MAKTTVAKVREKTLEQAGIKAIPRRNWTLACRFCRRYLLPAAGAGDHSRIPYPRPEVVLSPEQSNTPSLEEGLVEGRVDAAFIRPPIETADELEVELLIREDMVVVLPHTHPLARAGAPVSLSALAEETFLLFPRAIGAGLYDAITSACQRAGFLPRLGQEAPQIVSIAPLVGAGFGVSIVPRSTTQIQTAEVVYLPIAGNAPKALISLAWRRHNPSPVVSLFLAVAREMAREWRKKQR